MRSIPILALAAAVCTISAAIAATAPASLGNQLGNSMSAPGSAFNPNGTAGGVYAGQLPQNSGNTASVSQYDVACARPSK